MLLRLWLGPLIAACHWLILMCFYRAVKSDIYVIFLIYQDRFLAYGLEQHPTVLLIWWNNLKNLAKATQLATPYGYEVINFINDTFSGLFNSCGCLNPRVAGGVLSCLIRWIRFPCLIHQTYFFLYHCSDTCTTSTGKVVCCIHVLNCCKYKSSCECQMQNWTWWPWLLQWTM